MRAHTHSQLAKHLLHCNTLYDWVLYYTMTPKRISEVNGGWSIITLASFPGLPTIQFLITCNMQKQRGRPGIIYHVNDVSVYLGRQRGGKGSLIERMHFAGAFFVFNQERYAFCFANVQNSSAWGRNYKIRPLAHSFDGGPLPPSVHLGRHWRHSCDKWYSPFPSVFAYCKQSKTGRWEGLGMRLHKNHVYWIVRLRGWG